jgi:hypothetical protein
MKVICRCQHCNQGLEFDSWNSGKSTICPHCGMDTIVFMKQPEPKKRFPWKMVAILSAIPLAIIIGLIFCMSGTAIALGAILWIAVLAGALFFYFLPALVGHGKRNATAIFLLNLFVGWTFIGWVVALVWAATKDPETK